jgi:hypothetical protein
MRDDMATSEEVAEVIDLLQGVFCHNERRPRPESLGASEKSPFGDK